MGSCDKDDSVHVDTCASLDIIQIDLAILCDQVDASYMGPIFKKERKKEQIEF